MVTTGRSDVRWAPPASGEQVDGQAQAESALRRPGGGMVAAAARLTAVKTLVVVGIVVGVLALWKLKILVALLFLAMIVAAAMRPGVDALARRRVPRIAAVLLHYFALLGLIALFLSFVVPQALDQVGAALGNAPNSRSQIARAAAHSSGIKRDVLLAIDHRLKHLPPASRLIHPVLSITKTALEVLVAIFFVLASAAYWIFERDRAQRFVLALLAPHRRRVVRETWDVVDAKLGAFVRGQLLLISFVSTILSLAFWQIGLPYWLLLGVFAGIVEIVPVVGPLAAGLAAIGVGMTVSWQKAALAAIAVYGLRLIQDYILGPRVLGHAVGLTPLVVLVAVSVVGLLAGPWYVPLATPFTAAVVTLLDVLVRGREPSEHEPPRLIFPSQDTETG
jgi:predicted PurR-regulated permease PerM